jgi:hypothetical protein
VPRPRSGSRARDASSTEDCSGSPHGRRQTV